MYWGLYIYWTERSVQPEYLFWLQPSVRSAWLSVCGGKMANKWFNFVTIFLTNYSPKLRLLFNILKSSMSNLILLYPYYHSLIRSLFHGQLNFSVQKSMLKRLYIGEYWAIKKLTLCMHSLLHPHQLSSLQFLYMAYYFVHS